MHGGYLSKISQPLIGPLATKVGDFAEGSSLHSKAGNSSSALSGNNQDQSLATSPNTVHNKSCGSSTLKGLKIPENNPIRAGRLENLSGMFNFFPEGE